MPLTIGQFIGQLDPSKDYCLMFPSQPEPYSWMLCVLVHFIAETKDAVLEFMNLLGLLCAYS